MSSALQAFEGRCHCGALGFSFHTVQPPARWNVRACQCSFCRAHGARTVSDPSGSVTFRFTAGARLQRYCFGTRSSEFLVCGDCGVYVAALLTSSKGQFATLNINTMHASVNAPEAIPVSYDDESIEQRRSRREQRWTPVAEAI